MKTLIRGILIPLLFSLPAFPQTAASGNAKDTDARQHETAVLFDEIMQTLPSDMKAKVDSASACARSDAGRQEKGSSAAASAAQKQPALNNDRDAAVQKLPEDVRAKVEKAISDIDFMNQDRQIQFKDYEKKHQGGK